MQYRPHKVYERFKDVVIQARQDASLKPAHAVLAKTYKLLVFNLYFHLIQFSSIPFTHISLSLMQDLHAEKYHVCRVTRSSGKQLVMYNDIRSTSL